MQPDPHKIQGIGAGFVPANLNLNLVDRVEKVGRAEAMVFAPRLIRQEGTWPASPAALWWLQRLAWPWMRPSSAKRSWWCSRILVSGI